MVKVAVFGAAGKMGTRVSEALCASRDYEVVHVEAGEAAAARLKERGVRPVAADEAARLADAVILAVPDRLIRDVASAVVPKMRSGAMLVCLDPAAPLSGDLPGRADVTYFVCHPCHPPVIRDEAEPEARMDCFGGIARQHCVAALMQGPEKDYARGEAIVRAMWAPVMNVHRITVEQMALLEPALTESFVLPFIVAMRQALDEVVARGVPREAARDFVLGHIGVDIGIYFGFLDIEVSDGAKVAAGRGMERLIAPDWRDLFTPESVREQVLAITRARGSRA